MADVCLWWRYGVSIEVAMEGWWLLVVVLWRDVFVKSFLYLHNPLCSYCKSKVNQEKESFCTKHRDRDRRIIFAPKIGFCKLENARYRTPQSLDWPCPFPYQPLLDWSWGSNESCTPHGPQKQLPSWEVSLAWPQLLKAGAEAGERRIIQAPHLETQGH